MTQVQATEPLVYLLDIVDILYYFKACIVRLIVKALVSRGGYRRFEPDRLNPKTNIRICYISEKDAELRERTKTYWLGIRIMCPREATCPPWTVVSVS